MRLIDADKIYPDIRTQKGMLGISQGQLAYAPTINAIPIPEGATNEEAIKLLVNATFSDEWQGNEDLTTAYQMAIQALEQEPCEDAISREDALLALTGKWTELTDEIIHRFIKRIKSLPPVNPQPCEDAISRQAVCDYIAEFVNNEYSSQAECEMVDATIEGIQHLPPVKPQPKTGHWIDTNGGVECDKCGKWYPHAPIAKNEIKFCSECGAKMVEPQEREE